jgi:hypothetical protein
MRVRTFLCQYRLSDQEHGYDSLDILVRCSSKSACYLCNLFFQLHSGFHVPRTHGRLYDKWILPYWLDVPIKRHRELGIISTNLKATLDTKQHYERSGAKPNFQGPDEMTEYRKNLTRRALDRITHGRRSRLTVPRSATTAEGKRVGGSSLISLRLGGGGGVR